MTSPQDPGQSEEELRAELQRVEDQRAELLNEARDARAELADAGPMDAADRASILTRAEELEAFAAELERRHDTLRERLGEST